MPWPAAVAIHDDGDMPGNPCLPRVIHRPSKFERPPKIQGRALDLHDFLFLLGQNLVDLDDRVVGHLLDLVGLNTAFILADIPILLGLLKASMPSRRT